MQRSSALNDMQKVKTSYSLRQCSSRGGGCKTLRSAWIPPPFSRGLYRNTIPMFLMYLVKLPLLSEINLGWNPGLGEVSEIIPVNCMEQSDTVCAAQPPLLLFLFYLQHYQNVNISLSLMSVTSWYKLYNNICAKNNL